MEYGFYFWLKKMVGMLIASPLTAWFLLTIIVLALFHKRTRKRYLVMGSFFVLWFLSAPVTSHFLLVPLERNQVGWTQFEPSIHKDPEGIIVLGCGHSENPDLPVSSQYQTCSLTRIVHGVLLHKQTGMPLYFSGGLMPFKTISEARNNAKLAVSLGVSPDNIIIVEGAMDTYSESFTLKEALGDKKAVLVTSASHIRRANNYLKNAGIVAYASPTDHLVKEKAVDFYNPYAYLPNSKGLIRTRSAFYEWLGLAGQAFIQ